MNPPRILVILATVALVLAAGCSSGEGDDAATTADEVGVDGSEYDRGIDIGVATGSGSTGSSGGSTGSGGQSSGGPATGGPATGGPATGGDGPVTAVGVDVDLAAATADRKIVYRGSVESVVDDVAAAVGSARDSVAAEGGFLFGQESSGQRSRIVFKVPTLAFDAAFDAVAGIGAVESTFVEADDVSEQYVDLDSRRATLATSIDRLRGFLAEAGNVDEISRLESELTRREAELNIILGQLRVLDDRTSLATITATFRLDDGENEVTVVDAGGLPGFRDGLEAGWDAVTAVFGAVATATGFLLPFVPVIIAAGAGAAGWRRRAGRDGLTESAELRV